LVNEGGREEGGGVGAGCFLKAGGAGSFRGERETWEREKVTAASNVPIVRYSSVRAHAQSQSDTLEQSRRLARRGC
jgi:hypothetical protein